MSDKVYLKSQNYWTIVEEYIKIKKTNNASYHESIMDIFKLFDAGSSNIKHAINQTLISLLGTTVEGLKIRGNETVGIQLKPIPEYDQKMKELNDKIELLTEISEDLRESFWRVKEERDNLQKRLNNLR
jgi:uncharacterized phage-like protein YoqJ